ncbi:MAG: terminase small subunit [bacterium]|nr:terminase small subunit [bacterium]
MAKELNAKQQRFVEEYLIDLNATQAAIRAGYSEKTAHSIGHENLNKPEIAAAIDLVMVERSERVGISQDYVLNGLVLNHRRAMQLERQNGGQPKYDGAVANRSLELLGKHLGMFTDKLEVSGGLSIEDRLAKLAERGNGSK